MIKIILSNIVLLITTVTVCNAQDKKEKNSVGLGLKAGYNFAKVTGASQINTGNTNGFHIGGFYSPGSTQSKGVGYRTEIIYSKQGYDFAKGSTTGTVNLDYILLPQLTTFNITKFVQLQLGAQVAFLINAQADSAVNNGGSNSYTKVADYYNKIDYGFAGGVEIRPFKGLLVGVRLNISFANSNKEQAATIGLPAFIPNAGGTDLKNNVLQIFAGWKF